MITHPDYMNCKEDNCGIEEYPIKFYKNLHAYVKGKHKGQYWNALPRDVASLWEKEMSEKGREVVQFG